MKQVTFKQIKSFKLCYQPEEIGMPENYSATLIDAIKEYRHKVKNKDDIQWVVLRKEFFTDKQLRLFAVWCARKALDLIENPDKRSINACDVAEKYANGEATEEERAAAGDAARAAARDAAWAAAWAAARDAARDAAWDAAWDAAGDAAGDAARDAQIDKIIKIIETGEVTFDDL